jgi:hypothetical protein
VNGGKTFVAASNSFTVPYTAFISNAIITNGTIGGVGIADTNYVNTSSQNASNAAKAYADSLVSFNTILYFYGSSNLVEPTIEPTGNTYQMFQAVPTASSMSNVIAVASNAQYVAAFIGGSTYKTLSSGSAEVMVYMDVTGGSISIAPEFYVWNTAASNLIEMGTSTAQAVSGTKTLYTYYIPVTNFASTTNLKSVIRLKSSGRSGNPSLRIYSMGTDISHFGRAGQLVDYLPLTGGTVTGPTIFNSSIGVNSLAISNMSDGAFLISLDGIIRCICPDSTYYINDNFLSWATTGGGNFGASVRTVNGGTITVNSAPAYATKRKQNVRLGMYSTNASSYSSINYNGGTFSAPQSTLVSTSFVYSSTLFLTNLSSVTQIYAHTNGSHIFGVVSNFNSIAPLGSYFQYRWDWSSNWVAVLGATNGWQYVTSSVPANLVGDTTLKIRMTNNVFDYFIDGVAVAQLSNASFTNLPCLNVGAQIYTTSTGTSNLCYMSLTRLLFIGE